MNNNKTNKQDRDFGTRLMIFFFCFAEWFDDMLHWGDSYIYYSANIYVSKDGAITAANLQSQLRNIRKHYKTGKWQIKHIDKETGIDRWEDLTQGEIEATINPALANGQTPVFNFCM